MKKRFLTLLVSCGLVSTVVAQERVNMDGYEMKHKSTTTYEELLNPNAQKATNKKLDVSGWYSPVNAASTLGGNFENFVNFMVEDSNLVVVPSPSAENTDPYHTAFHAVGTVLAPHDPAFEAFEQGVYPNRFNNTVVVDSIQFRHLYIRQVDFVDLGNGPVEVVDTLVVEFYQTSDLNTGWSFTGGDLAGSRFAVPDGETRYNPATIGLNNPTYRVEIPLRKEDATDTAFDGGYANMLRSVAIPDGVNKVANDPNIAGANTIGFSFHFKMMKKPGYKDTLYAADDAPVGEIVNKYNAGGYLYFANTGTDIIHDTYLQNSFFTPKWLLYGPEPGWQGPKGFYPMTGLNTPQYMFGQFHLTFDIDKNSAASRNLDGYSLVGAYPNPQVSGEALNIEFTLGNNEEVTIELYDLVGKKVQTLANGSYNQGSHTVSTAINNLSSGVYFYRLTAGDYTAAKKITIK